MSSIEAILKSETSAEALTSALDGQGWLFADPDLSKDSAGIRTACIKNWKVLAQLLSMAFGLDEAKHNYTLVCRLSMQHTRANCFQLMACGQRPGCECSAKATFV